MALRRARRRREGRSPLLVGAVLLALVTLVTVLGFRKDLPFINEPYTVRAAFTDTSGIKKNSPVRIAGVEVGKVTGVEPAADGSPTGVLTLAIREKGRPIKADARMRIRPRIFLEGNFYVEVEPGTPGAPELDEDGVIPTAQTSNPVQLDEVLKVLQTNVRDDLSTTFRQLGLTQRAGGGRGFNDALRHQPAALRYSAVVADALQGRVSGDLGDALADQGTISAALDRDPVALQGLVTALNRTAGALASEERDLRATLRELPRTLSAGMPALAALNAAFPSVRRFAQASLPAIRSTGPSAQALVPAVRQLRGLVGEAELRGLSRDLRTATPSLASVAEQSVPALEQLRALSSCTANVLVPFGDAKVPDKNFPATGPIHEEFPKGLVGLAGESRSFDANGQFFKVLGQGGLETVSLGNGLLGTTASTFGGANPPPQRTRPPLERDAPCEAQELPDLRTIPGAAPQRVDAKPSSPAAVARGEQAREVAIAALRRQLKAAGIDLPVLERSATAADVEGLARRLGLLEQLDKVGGR